MSCRHRNNDVRGDFDRNRGHCGCGGHGNVAGDFDRRRRDDLVLDVDRVIIRADELVIRADDVKVLSDDRRRRCDDVRGDRDRRKCPWIFGF